MTRAMILAAGFGLRLRPLTERRAKALVPIGDRPAMAHVVDRLRDASVTEIVVNAHHRAEDLRAFAGTHGLLLSMEDQLLGTAGGVARAETLLGRGDLLVWNADIVADVEVHALMAAHKMKSPRATLVVHPRPAGEGVVGTDAEGRIVRMRSTRVADEVAGGDFLGVYVLSDALRQRLPVRGCLIGDVCLVALLGGEELRAFCCWAPWHDVGTLRSYLRANLAWLDARRAAHWSGPAAVIADGIGIERAVVGEGASVEGRGMLTRCVVWPGARAIAPLADAIVTPDFVVQTDSSAGSGGERFNHVRSAE